MARQPHVLIIVENLTVPLDRRVWQEATTLRDAGYVVSVICPKGGRYTRKYQLLEGIHVFRHPMAMEADGALVAQRLVDRCQVDMACVCRMTVARLHRHAPLTADLPSRASPAQPVRSNSKTDRCKRHARPRRRQGADSAA